MTTNEMDSYDQTVCVFVLFETSVVFIITARSSAQQSQIDQSMGMTSCDTCWPPGNNTRNARKINSSALRCLASSTSVTSSCGENSGVR